MANYVDIVACRKCYREIWGAVTISS